MLRRGRKLVQQRRTIEGGKSATGLTPHELEGGGEGKGTDVIILIITRR